jgi:GntR family transcriptional regulator
VNDASKGGRGRHDHVARQLLREIQEGQWPVGSHLPNEADLSTRYSLSRYGIREAVQTLVDLGVVSRQQGVGTCVLSDKARVRYTQRGRSLDDLAQYTRGTRYVVLRKERVEPESPLREFLNARAGERWLRLEGLRYADSQPIASSTVCINPRFAHLPKLGKVLHAPIFSLIEEQYGVRITRVDEEINAVLVPEEAAESLHVRAGTAALRVVRRYFVGDDVIEMTDGCHPAQHFSYSASFEVASAGSLPQAGPR